MCKKNLTPKLLMGRNDSVSKRSPMLLAKHSNTATSLGMKSHNTTTIANNHQHQPQPASHWLWWQWHTSPQQQQFEQLRMAFANSCLCSFSLISTLFLPAQYAPRRLHYPECSRASQLGFPVTAVTSRSGRDLRTARSGRKTCNFL